MRRKFPPEAIEAFRRMQTIEGDRDAWWTEHERLHKLLRAKPWQFPCVENPDWEFGPGYQQSPEAQKLYRELMKASLPVA